MTYSYTSWAAIKQRGSAGCSGVLPPSGQAGPPLGREQRAANRRSVPDGKLMNAHGALNEPGSTQSHPLNADSHVRQQAGGCT